MKDDDKDILKRVHKLIVENIHPYVEVKAEDIGKKKKKNRT